MGIVNPPSPGPDIEPEMNTIEKVALIRNVAAEIDRRYVLSEVKAFLANFGIKTPLRKRSDSIPTYIRKQLIGISDAKLIEMDELLNIDTSDTKKQTDSQFIKAFISHSDPADSRYAKELKDALIKYNIDAFVSSRNLVLGDNFSEKIQRHLKGMDFFIALYSKSFSKSPWCQQEAGFAFARGVNVFSIKIRGAGNPEGFIGIYNAIGKTGKSTQQIVDAILEGLRESEKTRDLYDKKVAPIVNKEIAEKSKFHEGPLPHGSYEDEKL